MNCVSCEVQLWFTSSFLFQFFLDTRTKTLSRHTINSSACRFYDVLCDYESERRSVAPAPPNRSLTSALALGSRWASRCLISVDLLRRIGSSPAVIPATRFYGDLSDASFRILPHRPDCGQATNRLNGKVFRGVAPTQERSNNPVWNGFEKRRFLGCQNPIKTQAVVRFWLFFVVSLEERN